VKRHLLPNEIDLLLDGEVGFGVTPLKAHIRTCTDCRAKLDEARQIVTALEHLPHLAPSPQFADRLMSRVQVFVPWHVAALDSARRFVPRSQPVRYLVGAMAASLALIMTSLSVWVFARADMAVFFADLVASRTREFLINAVGSALAGTFGEPAVALLRGSGLTGLALALAALLTATVAVAFGMRALVGVASRRRS
jgi:hypothetical protein